MSTLDVVNQAGGSAANFLDIGGGANADVMAAALEVINTDDNVASILVNIFGGITRVDEVAKGILAALERVDITVADRAAARRHERRGRGARLLAPHLSDRLIAAPTMLEAADRAVRTGGQLRWPSSSTSPPRSSSRASPAARAASTACATATTAPRSWAA